jgi:hypothetical protein
VEIETGQLIRLQIPIRTRTLWLSPAWAVVCGIIASSAFMWTGREVLIAALALVIADATWATVWWGLVDTDWRSLFATWDTFDVSRIEATWGAAGSSAARSQHGLARLRLWWQAIGKPQAGSPLMSALFSVVLAFLLSAVIGGAAVGLTLAALALAQIGFLLRVHGRAVNGLRGFVEVGLAWLLGHVAFGPLTLPSALTALIFSFSYAAMLDLAQAVTWNKTHLLVGSTRRWLLPQFVMVLVLVLLQQPLAALGLFVMLIAQASLSTALHGLDFARPAQLWLMLAMLIAALGIR